MTFETWLIYFKKNALQWGFTEEQISNTDKTILYEYYKNGADPYHLIDELYKDE